MNKIIEFLKSKKQAIKWTIGYFAFLWFILKFIFNFDMLSAHYWHRFFHASFHGLPGFIFCVIVYSAIPIYIASVSVINRNNAQIIKIPFVDKVSEFISKIFSQKQTETIAEPESEQTSEPEPVKEYPDDIPAELRIPYIRAKHNIRPNISVYNKIQQPEMVAQQTTPESFGATLPSDFEMPDFENNSTTESDFIPTFTDINFDEPKPTKFENNTTKYFDEKHIEYETYKEFVATEKYLIYEHNDGDFWIMDENDWFASGKQITSPIPELIDIAKQNGLIPVLYLQSQNIMDIENTTNTFESTGVRVVKSLDELG